MSDRDNSRGGQKTKIGFCNGQKTGSHDLVHALPDALTHPMQYHPIPPPRQLPMQHLELLVYFRPSASHLKELIHTLPGDRGYAHRPHVGIELFQNKRERPTAWRMGHARTGWVKLGSTVNISSRGIIDKEGRQGMDEGMQTWKCDDSRDYRCGKTK